jgi:hypothetical protein
MAVVAYHYPGPMFSGILAIPVASGMKRVRMTTSPGPASSTRQDSRAQEVIKVPLLLAEERLSKQSIRVGTAPQRPGIALVYSRPDGSLVDLNRPLKLTEVLTGQYSLRYEISLADHEHEFYTGRELPTLDEVSSFAARLHVGFRAHSPQEIVKRRINDGLQLVRWRMLDAMRVISRKYPPEDAGRAEEEINKALGSQPTALEEGITVYRFAASIFLDDDTRETLRQRRAIEREAYTTRESVHLQQARIVDESAIEEQRTALLNRTLREGQGLIALHLARHPDDTRAIIDLLVDRYDKDRQERLELVRILLEAGLLQSVDVEAIRHSVLQSDSLKVLLHPFGRDEFAWDQEIKPRPIGSAAHATPTDDTERQQASVPVEIYLDTEDHEVAERVFSATDSLLTLIGLLGPLDVEIVRGSIWRRANARIQEGLQSDEVRMILIKVERAIELAQIEGRQADVDAKQAGAVSQLLGSLSEVPQACVRVGSLLLIKYTEPTGPVVLSRSLSQPEIYALDRFPEIQTKPREVLAALASAVSMNETGDDL